MTAVREAQTVPCAVKTERVRANQGARAPAESFNKRTLESRALTRDFAKPGGKHMNNQNFARNTVPDRIDSMFPCDQQLNIIYLTWHIAKRCVARLPFDFISCRVDRDKLAVVRAVQQTSEHDVGPFPAIRRDANNHHSPGLEGPVEKKWVTLRVTFFRRLFSDYYVFHSVRWQPVRQRPGDRATPG